MHSLPARKPWLCLSCTVAAARSLPQKIVRLPSSTRAFTSSAVTSAKRHRNRIGNVGQLSPRPLRGFEPRFRNPIIGHHNEVGDVVRNRLARTKRDLSEPEFLESLALSREDFDVAWLKLESQILRWSKDSADASRMANEDRRGKNTLAAHIRHAFYAQVSDAKFTAAELENQKKVANLCYPAEWFPATREIHRTVHMHVGPTNSGKTYHALKRLENAKSGIYLGPLRLLAHEVYSRLNAKGKPCALITGEEQRVPEEASMFSCTIEMAPLNAFFEVAVIDEIQMISHDERGWAWTQAFLGLQAKEIHLCGEARSVPLMRELCALAGDQLHLHEYERLTPLRVANESLGGLRNLQKGDCIVAFTILGIHALRQEIERMTNRKCAIVYGSLPPETRAQQARLFNEPDNDYDFLVASDAIGMGLNLAIKRIIFESTVKSNGINLVQLQVSEVKQIAGRAGRYRTAHQAVTADNAEDAEDTAVDLDDKNPKKPPSEPTVGWVTTMESVDRPHLRACMAEEPAPIKTAGIFPPSLIVERFSNYFPPHTPFTYILLRLLETCDVNSRFHLCRLKDQLTIADVIQVVGNLSIQDRITICNAPLNATGQLEAPFCRELAECIASGENGGFLDLKTLPLNFMDVPMQPGRSYLFALEQLHKMIVCYLWLSFRYPNVFTTRAVAERAKSLVEARIEESLTQFSFTKQAAEEIRRRRERARKKLDAMNEKSVDSASETNPSLRSPVESQLVSQKI